MHSKEIKTLSNSDLDNRIIAYKRKLCLTKINNKVNTTNNTSIIRSIRKEVAVLLTEKNIRKLTNIII